MRFSIRDLSWLTAVVALAATIYGDRLRTTRLAQKWAEERAQIVQITDAALARMRLKVTEVHVQNLLQERRFEVQLAAERKQHERDLQTLRAAATAAALRTQHTADAGAHIELSAQQP